MGDDAGAPPTVEVPAVSAEGVSAMLDTPGVPVVEETVDGALGVRVIPVCSSSALTLETRGVLASDAALRSLTLEGVGDAGEGVAAGSAVAAATLLRLSLAAAGTRGLGTLLLLAPLVDWEAGDAISGSPCTSTTIPRINAATHAVRILASFTRHTGSAIIRKVENLMPIKGVQLKSCEIMPFAAERFKPQAV